MSGSWLFGRPSSHGRKRHNHAHIFYLLLLLMKSSEYHSFIPMLLLILIGHSLYLSFFFPFYLYIYRVLDWFSPDFLGRRSNPAFEILIKKKSQFGEIQKSNYCSIDGPCSLDTNCIHSLQTYTPCLMTATMLLLP